MYPRFATVLAFACGGLLLAAGPASAGWIAISNDTNQTLVVQESVTVNGQVRKCKALKLAPGEVLREFRPAGGTKTLTVSETGLLGKQLFSGDLTWTADAAFAIRKGADGVKVADAAKPAATQEAKRPK